MNGSGVLFMNVSRVFFMQLTQKVTLLLIYGQKLMKVVSCSRTATGDGYSFIQAVVQLNSDDKMQGVNENIRLHFSFLREPQFHDNTVGADSHGLIHEVDSVQCSNGEHKTDSKQDSTVRAKRKRGDSLDDTNNTKKQKQCIDNEMNCNDSTEEYHGNGFIPKTIITYRVDYSVDWGRQQRLFGVDIYAAGEFPSVEEAIPIMDDDNSLSDTDSDGEKNIDANGDENFNGSNDKQSTAGSSEFEDIEMSSNGDQSNEGVLRDDAEAADRFGVFVDPENTLAFLERLNANFNEQSVFHFLLMFPFYEHEWDISGFLLSSLCDDDEDDCDEEMSNEEDLKEGVCIPCPIDNE